MRENRGVKAERAPGQGYTCGPFRLNMHYLEPDPSSPSAAVLDCHALPVGDVTPTKTYRCGDTGG